MLTVYPLVRGDNDVCKQQGDQVYKLSTFHAEQAGKYYHL